MIADPFFDFGFEIRYMIDAKVITGMNVRILFENLLYFNTSL